MPALSLLLAALGAQPDAGVSPEPPGIILRQLETNKAAADLTQGLSAIFSERVTSANPNIRQYSQADLERVIPPERQVEQLSCSDDACLLELAGAVGARYLISGRVDRFGDLYVLIAGLFDADLGKTVVQARREVVDPGKLPKAADEVADELLVPLGVKPRVLQEDRLDTTGFTLSFNLSSQFFTSFSHLAPGGELEIGYRFTPHVQTYFLVSFLVSFGEMTTTSLVPGELGARYFFRAGKTFQPYAALGLGLLFAIRRIEGDTTSSAARPSLWTHAGLAAVVFKWLAVTLDLSVDVLGAAISLFQDDKLGVSFGGSLGVMFRF